MNLNLSSRQLSASNALATLVMASDIWKANAKGQPGLMEEILAALAEHMVQLSDSDSDSE